MSAEDEAYADAFAYALLMPEREVVQRVNTGLGLATLAKAFGVQTSTMRTRLEQLGLWDNVGMAPRPRRRWDFLGWGFQRGN
jgi:Zn-dependent peptidase ImmA (M78 family)